jgi:hypothetical protein
MELPAISDIMSRKYSVPLIFARFIISPEAEPAQIFFHHNSAGFSSITLP